MGGGWREKENKSTLRAPAAADKYAGSVMPETSIFHDNVKYTGPTPGEGVSPRENVRLASSSIQMCSRQNGGVLDGSRGEGGGRASRG